MGRVSTGGLTAIVVHPNFYKELELQGWVDENGILTSKYWADYREWRKRQGLSEWGMSSDMVDKENPKNLARRNPNEE